MKHVLIMVCLFFVMTGCAFAETHNWKFICAVKIKTNNVFYYYDANSVEVKRMLRDVNVLAKDENGISEKLNKMVLWEINCETKQFRGLNFVHYNDDGSVKSISDEPSELINIVPKSMMDLLQNILCK